jgi:hypothetical protein
MEGSSLMRIRSCARAGSAALIACASAAHAGFVSLQSEKTVVSGKNVWRVYATFNSANDVLISCSGLQGLAGTLWNNSDFLSGSGGSWNPQFTVDAGVDSYVTIGGTTGFANTTAADPSWGALAFNQSGIPNGAGWFNANPDNEQGKVDQVTLRTLIGQWVYTGPERFNPFSPLTIAFNQGLGTPTQFAQGVFIFFPSPGAIGVLGLAAITGRSRRRA